MRQIASGLCLILALHAVAEPIDTAATRDSSATAAAVSGADKEKTPVIWYVLAGLVPCAVFSVLLLAAGQSRR